MNYTKPELRSVGNALNVVQDPQNKAIPQVLDSPQDRGSINAYAADE